MKTTSYNKAKKILVQAFRLDLVTITVKEFIDGEIVSRKRNMKVWEALNLIENINKVAFVSLVA